jgi:hypothetical protein
MRRYIILYSAPKTVAERFAQATPEQAQKGLQLWVDWAKKLGSALIDPGKPLGNARKVTPKGVTKSDTQVIGMSILQANSMDEALEMVKNHHHLEFGEIDVLEEMPIPELEH